MISIKKALLLLGLCPIVLAGAGYYIWTMNKAEEVRTVQITVIEPTGEKEILDLAEANKLLKQHEEAAKWYKVRIDKGGDKEDVWYSKLKLAECYESLGDWE